MGKEPTQAPDELKLKEESDAKFVTEELAKMQPIVHRLLALWFIAVAVVSIWWIVRVWPAGGESSGGRAQVRVEGERAVADTLSAADTGGLAPADTAAEAVGAGEPMEKRYLLLSLLFGMLGGAAHGLASLMDFRGQRRLFRSWSLWYVGQPLLGGIMAFIFYVAVRAGLLSGEEASEVMNPYGVAAISALVGLFTDAATNKLGEVFKTIFAPSEKTKPREGQLNPDAGGKPE